MSQKMNMFLFYILLFHLFFLFTCISSESLLDDNLPPSLKRNKRSIGGSPVTPAEYNDTSKGYDAVVYVWDTAGTGWTSTGALISPNHVIASALYLRSKNDNNIYLALNYTDANSTSPTYQVVPAANVRIR
jgi:hypothetical protein